MEADEERNKSETAQAYAIPLYTLLTYLKYEDSAEQKALQGSNV
jgi:hypothetical protein